MGARALRRSASLSVASAVLMSGLSGAPGWADESPSPGPQVSRALYDVSADSPSDAWATGATGDGSPIVLHWDGARWRPVAVVPVGIGVTLNDVLAVSPTDVWVVGGFTTPAGRQHTLVEHWDGNSFSVMHSPNPNASLSVLTSVSGVSATDVWAAGEKSEYGQCIVQHWDGTAWREARSPGGYTCDVSAVGTDDVFSVRYRRLVRWDGQAWKTVARTRQYEGMRKVQALSDDDVWVIGDFEEPDGFAYHWDGSTWGDELLSCAYTGLDDVLALGPSDAWAVGGCPDELIGSILWHWDGGSWKTGQVSRHGRLHGLGGSASNDVWAVGEIGRKTLIEHWDGSTWWVYPGGQ